MDHNKNMESLELTDDEGNETTEAQGGEAKEGRRYLIDPIWPLREVHIITGESGVGKTTLLTQWVNDLVIGRPILGFKVSPQQVVYVSNERSQESLEIDNDSRWKLAAPFYTVSVAMDGVGLPDKDKWSKAGLVGLIKKYSEQGFKVMVVDPIVTFCPKPNDQNEVHRFLYTLAQNDLKKYDMTIIASGHPPKEREGAKILNIRQKVAGSQGWGSFSNCNMHLEPANDKNRMDTRVRLEVRSRHSPPMEFFFDRDEIGRLVEVPDAAGHTVEFIMLRLLENKEPVMHTKDAVEFGESRGLSRKQVTRWLQKLESAGVISHLERGSWNVRHDIGYTAFEGPEAPQGSGSAGAAVGGGETADEDDNQAGEGEQEKAGGQGEVVLPE